MNCTKISKEDYKKMYRGKNENSIPYKRYIMSNDETITIYKNCVEVKEYQLGDEIDIMFSSKNSPIIRGIYNPSIEEFDEILESYLAYEQEHKSPINKIKRLVKSKTRR